LRDWEKSTCEDKDDEPDDDINNGTHTTTTIIMSIIDNDFTTTSTSIKMKDENPTNSTYVTSGSSSNRGIFQNVMYIFA
jgi:hypothetical protein